jgi:proteasome lid subunit RPN8/RPN11
MKTQHISKMRVTESVLNEIVTHIGGRPAEAGGALFADENDVIREFVPDKNAKVTRSTYTIDHQFINSEIKRLRPKKLYIMGIVHSHPQGSPMLSGPDRQYFKGLLTNNLKRDFFYAPIVHSAVSGGFQLFAYVLDSTGSEVTKGRLEIVYDDELQANTKDTMPKISIQEVFRKIYNVQLTLLKITGILWMTWIIIRLFFSLPQFIIDSITHGTH